MILHTSNVKYMNVYIGKKQTVLSNIFKPIAKETQISRSAAVVYDVMF